MSRANPSPPRAMVEWERLVRRQAHRAHAQQEPKEREPRNLARLLSPPSALNVEEFAPEAWRSDIFWVATHQAEGRGGNSPRVDWELRCAALARAAASGNPRAWAEMLGEDRLEWGGQSHSAPSLCLAMVRRQNSNGSRRLSPATIIHAWGEAIAAGHLANGRPMLPWLDSAMRAARQSPSEERAANSDGPLDASSALRAMLMAWSSNHVFLRGLMSVDPRPQSSADRASLVVDPFGLHGVAKLCGEHAANDPALSASLLGSAIERAQARGGKLDKPCVWRRSGELVERTLCASVEEGLLQSFHSPQGRALGVAAHDMGQLSLARELATRRVGLAPGAESQSLGVATFRAALGSWTERRELLSDRPEGAGAAPGPIPTRDRRL